LALHPALSAKRAAGEAAGFRPTPWVAGQIPDPGSEIGLGPMASSLVSDDPGRPSVRFVSMRSRRQHAGESLDSGSVHFISINQ
jgi:hypothetical protein